MDKAHSEAAMAAAAVVAAAVGGSRSNGQVGRAAVGRDAGPAVSLALDGASSTLERFLAQVMQGSVTSRDFVQRATGYTLAMMCVAMTCGAKVAAVLVRMVIWQDDFDEAAAAPDDDDGDSFS